MKAQTLVVSEQSGTMPIKACGELLLLQGDCEEKLNHSHGTELLDFATTVIFFLKVF